MSKSLVKDFENLFEQNQIPFMEIIDTKQKDLDLTVKVYFPKIVANICKFLNDRFSLDNKGSVVIKKDENGYHKVDLSFTYNNKKIKIRVHSMLQNTWGIANKL